MFKYYSDFKTNSKYNLPKEGLSLPFLNSFTEHHICVGIYVLTIPGLDLPFPLFKLPPLFRPQFPHSQNE
jgi:hypothetical protein